ncbi:MAG: VPLPA-CTERM-specific exosortase XrtD [Methanosarcinales archaeon]|nr:MAG: VPLPA-CTERM-specific exosortase XrtD [Methanosarcinales archaeon]
MGLQIKPFHFMRTGIYVILLYGIYASTLRWLVINDWEREEYSYCYLIPFIVIYLIWLKREELIAFDSRPSWWGLLPILLGLAFFWLGELGGEYLTLYISFWLVVVGLCWIHLGWKKLKAFAFPSVFALTMFPLPSFLLTKLTLNLRLISSQLGVAMIQLYGMPAYREGNIIDLGFTQLQVVEACSGLHSLISLVVLCLLLVYFFKASFWKRAVLFISSVPVAIFANSIRIALTAVLYKYFGPGVAQGFFHGFSGWLIFVFCIPVLLLEMKILEKLPPVTSTTSDPGEAQGSKPKAQSNEAVIQRSWLNARFVVVVILLTATVALSHGIEFREEIPSSKPFSEFPLNIGEWSADQRQGMEQKFIDALDLSDYVIADYENDAGKQVNFYVAYYKSQSKGKSIHSPETCLPGSGWIFKQAGAVTIPCSSGDKRSIYVNRAVMEKDGHKQLVYYWFPQRGRILTNAYQLKIYAFWDALTKQRTDGALVRLIAPVHESEGLEEAEARLQKFTGDIVPVLEEYLPGK